MMTPAMPFRLAAERQLAAPSCRVDAGALFDDDDVARLRCLDGRGAEVTRRDRLSGVAFEPDRNNATRDPPIRGQAMNPRDGAGQAELVQRIGHRARVQPREPCQHVIHGSRTYNAEHTEHTEFCRQKNLNALRAPRALCCTSFLSASFPVREAHRVAGARLPSDSTARNRPGDTCSPAAFIAAITGYQFLISAVPTLKKFSGSVASASSSPLAMAAITLRSNSSSITKCVRPPDAISATRLNPVKLLIARYSARPSSRQRCSFGVLWGKWTFRMIGTLGGVLSCRIE